MIGNVYEGLSLEDSVNLFIDKGCEFRLTWQYPIQDMIEKAVIDRIRAIDGRTPEDIAKGCDAKHTVVLPFYLVFGDQERGEEHYCKYLENPADGQPGSGIVTAVWIDKDGKSHDYDIHELNDHLYLYNSLVRMGFFDDKYKSDFEY